MFSDINLLIVSFYSLIFIFSRKFKYLNVTFLYFFIKILIVVVFFPPSKSQKFYLLYNVCNTEGNIL